MHAGVQLAPIAQVDSILCMSANKAAQQLSEMVSHPQVLAALGISEYPDVTCINVMR